MTRDLPTRSLLGVGPVRVLGVPDPAGARGAPGFKQRYWGPRAVSGDEYADADYQYYDDGYAAITATLTVPASCFSCSRCQLVLDYDLLDQAGLPDTFEVFDDDPPVETEYGND